MVNKKAVAVAAVVAVGGVAFFGLLPDKPNEPVDLGHNLTLPAAPDGVTDVSQDDNGARVVELDTGEAVLESESWPLDNDWGSICRARLGQLTGSPVDDLETSEDENDIVCTDNDSSVRLMGVLNEQKDGYVTVTVERPMGSDDYAALLEWVRAAD